MSLLACKLWNVIFKDIFFESNSKTFQGAHGLYKCCFNCMCLWNSKWQAMLAGRKKKIQEWRSIQIQDLQRNPNWYNVKFSERYFKPGINLQNQYELSLKRLKCWDLRNRTELNSFYLNILINISAFENSVL